MRVHLVGVSGTGMGALSSVRLTEQQQLSHQRNLLLARAAGGPPWLSPPEVRAIMPTKTEIQQKHKAKAIDNAMAASVASTLVWILKPIR